MADVTLADLLNTTVTTASQNQEKLSEAPATIYVLTAAEIAARGYTRLDQLLEDLPETEIHYKSEPISSNWIVLRGASGNDHFLILLDGVRITSPLGDRMAVLGNFPVADAERVEVIVGPGSAIWGADAYGGVVNIITRQAKKNGTSPMSGRIQASGGRFGTQQANGFLQVGKGHLGFTASGGYERTEEPYFPRYFPTEYAWYTDVFARNGGLRVADEDDTARVAVPFQAWAIPSSAYGGQARLTWKSLEAGVFASGEMHSSSISTMAPYAVFSADARYGTSVRTGYARYQHQSKDERFTMMLQGAYTLYEVNPQSRMINAYTDYRQAWQYSRQHDLSTKAQFNYMFNRDHLLVGGLTWQHTDVIAPAAALDTAYGSVRDAEMQYSGTDLAYDFTKFIQQNTGIFAQYQTVAFARTLHITLGARYDANSRYGSTFNPRLGFIYAPEKSKFSFKMLYGGAFRAPTPLETFMEYGALPAAGSGDTTIHHWRFANPELKPEKLRMLELIGSYKNEFIIFNVNTYAQVMYNIIEEEYVDTLLLYKGFLVSEYSTSENEGLNLAYGGTFRVTTIRKAGNLNLNLWALYSYANGFSEEEHFLQHLAMHTFKAGAVISGARWSVSPRLIWRGQTFGANYDANGYPIYASPAFALLNLDARYHLWGQTEKGGTIFIHVRNLTDSRYYNVGTDKDDIYMGIVPQDPARFSAGLSLSF